MHLVLDLYGCDFELLSGIYRIHNLLILIPNQLEMNRLCDPIVVQHLADTDDEWGVTGFVVIAESHVSIHTYPNRGMALVDIFSCKAFNVERTIQYVRDYFVAQNARVALLQRDIMAMNQSDEQIAVGVPQ